jgi:hypothetical protein
MVWHAYAFHVGLSQFVLHNEPSLGWQHYTAWNVLPHVIPDAKQRQ